MRCGSTLAGALKNTRQTFSVVPLESLSSIHFFGVIPSIDFLTTILPQVGVTYSSLLGLAFAYEHVLCTLVP